MTALIPVTISIDRTGMPGDPGPLVMKNDRTTALTIISFREAALQVRERNAGDSIEIDGDGPTLGFKWQQTLIPFEVAARDAVSETAARAAIAELVAAVFRASYLVTITVDGAAAEQWSCKPSSVVPSVDRDYVNLRDHDPAWAVSLSAHPIRTIV